MSPGSRIHSSVGSKSASSRRSSCGSSAVSSSQCRADLPAPPAQALDQEHVVLVEMRADAAAVDRVADHHVVDAPVGDEAERLEQRGHRGHVVIDGLHQQRPRLLAEPAEAALGEAARARAPSCRRLR